MLNKKQIEELIINKKLIENHVDINTQLTPNGFDVTVEKIFKFSGKGKVDFSNKERQIPETKEIIAQKQVESDKFGWWDLSRGIYKVRINEIINLPTDLAALSFSRSTLLRMGAYTQHGVWDAGFCGKGEFVLVVDNAEGITIKQNARVAQLVFFPVDETEAYNGIYKGIK
ncbi:MAG: deoxyuridine 5'-triphosphate nucleotidohydrolase [Candidatus Omnitrophica bacterium]|nr:deoxyuridine 5'-triphosphate nucleotidohydrolase [Candidatus Omnitrophota bacterium]